MVIVWGVLPSTTWSSISDAERAEGDVFLFRALNTARMTRMAKRPPPTADPAMIPTNMPDDNPNVSFSDSSPDPVSCTEGNGQGQLLMEKFALSV
jgi:hypothetical protein